MRMSNATIPCLNNCLKQFKKELTENVVTNKTTFFAIQGLDKVISTILTEIGSIKRTKYGYKWIDVEPDEEFAVFIRETALAYKYAV